MFGELAADLRDADAYLAACGDRRRAAPHGVDQSVDGDDPVGLQEQGRQQDLLPVSVELDDVVVAPDRERTEHAEVDNAGHRTSPVRHTVG